jgi:hypothetical protein
MLHLGSMGVMFVDARAHDSPIDVQYIIYSIVSQLLALMFSYGMISPRMN